MIDEIAGIAAQDLRETLTSDLDAGLRMLYADHHARRRRRSVAAVAAAVVLVLGVGWWGGHVLTHPSSAGPAAPTPNHRAGTAGACSGPDPCLGPATFHFPLTRPVSWEIPGGYEVTRAGATPWVVKTATVRGQQGGGPYQYDTAAGVTVFEDVRAASTDGRSIASRVTRTPQALLSWLATRPYLRASSVARARLGGMPAWRVRVTLADSRGRGPGLCDATVACYPLTVTPDHRVNGIWGSMVADLTAFRLPGAGTTLVWSWAFSHDHQALARNRNAVRGLSWPE